MVPRDHLLIKTMSFKEKNRLLNNKHLKFYLENLAFVDQIFIEQLLYALDVGELYLTDERGGKVNGKLHDRMARLQ